jgi:thiol-disulfide isomerase/thioredoxin
MLHCARNAYATLTLCALATGFAPPRPGVARCAPRPAEGDSCAPRPGDAPAPAIAPSPVLSPDREVLHKLRVKELQAELGLRNIRWQTFLEKEELVVALSEALEAAAGFSGSGAMAPGLVADLTAEQLELELQHDGAPLLLDVYATWCGPCQLMAPELRKAAAALGANARVAKLDSDAFPQLSETLRVGGLPTIIAFKGGRESKRMEGAIMCDDLVQMVS